jgi:glycosyltransferase involved in cell wall biosynthesis
MRKKVLYIISKVTDSTEYEYLVRDWDRERFDLEFLLLNPVPDCSVQRHILAAGFPCLTIPYYSGKDSWRCTRAIMRYLKKSRPDVVHANLLEASVLGLLASKITGIGKRVYTRHVASHNHKYHPVKGVFYDRLCNWLAHKIIAITRSTEEVVVKWEGVKPEKVVLIYHGFNLNAPHQADPSKLAALKAKHGLDRVKGPVIAVISRPYELKGLDHALPAIGDVLREHPDALAVFFNWKPTQQSPKYDAMLRELPAGQWRAVEFEPEVAELYHALDVFVHVPEDQHAEAFGLVYVEAMIAGTPSIFTASGVMHDVDPSGLKGVTMVPFKDRNAIANALRYWVAQRPSEQQRKEFATTNTAYLRPMLDLPIKMEALYRLYASL